MASIAQKQMVIAFFLERNPSLTDVALAKKSGWHRTTVSRIRASLNCARAPKPPSSSISARRSLVRCLAVERRVKKGRTRCAFPSSASIARELARRHGIRVSRQTIFRDLVTMGFKSRVRQRVPTISALDLQRRLRFARKWVGVSAARMLFSDECIVGTNCAVPRRQWIPPRGKPGLLVRERWPRRVMIHGIIGVGFRKLDFFRMDEKLNADTYRKKILVPLAKFVRNTNKIWMMDGARPHVARANKEFLTKNKVAWIDDWPARSPMLNPIEQLWSIIHRRVSAMMPDTEEELIACIKLVWGELDQAMIDRLVLSFKDKCKRVVDKKGKE